MAGFSLVLPLSHNTGADLVDVALTVQGGGAVNLGLVKNWDWTPEVKPLDSFPIPMRGAPLLSDTYHGANGTFTIERSDGSIEALHLLFANSYAAGTGQIYCTITATIANRAQQGQAPTVLTFTGCVAALTKSGPYSIDAIVEQTVTFRASAFTQS